VAERLRTADLPTRQVRGPLAVIYGPGHETYGHWLIDFLPRLWVLSRAGFDIHLLRYAVPPDLGKPAAELLSRLGIRQSQLVPYRYWREVIRTDLLLMPTGLRAGNQLSTMFAEASRFWTAPLLRQAAGTPSLRPRLFLSRAGVASPRTLANRAAVEDVARESGYAIVRPETLGLIEQVALFAGARIVVGEYGSALHGTVFSRPGTISLGLRGNLRHPSFVQSGLAASLGQHVGYVLGETSGDVVQSFSLTLEDVRHALEIAEMKEAVLF
jgi:capsular polysaccharide biosynthesis protein